MEPAGNAVPLVSDRHCLATKFTNTSSAGGAALAAARPTEKKERAKATTRFIEDPLRARASSDNKSGSPIKPISIPGTMASCRHVVMFICIEYPQSKHVGLRD